MTKMGLKLSGVAAGACLYAFALPAMAQDGVGATKPTDAAAERDRDAAVKTMPTYEAFGVGETETLEETFFRLSRDFVTTSEDGFRRLGHVPIWPRGELKVGGFRILPYVREAVEYQRNFYLHANTGPSSSDHGRKGQWTHVNEAGILADTALMGGRLKIAASAVSIWNVRYNEVKDTWEMDAELGATYRWPAGAWVSGGVSYTRRHDPNDLPVNTARFGNDDFSRTDLESFFHFGFDRDIFFGSKLRFEFGINSKDSGASDSGYEDLNRTETTVYAKASYPFLRDTTRLFAIARYRFDNRQSESLNDGKTFGMDVGIEGSIPLRQGEYRGLRGQVSVGFDSSLYSDDRFQRGTDTIIADENRQSSHLRLTAALQYLMSPRSTVELRYLHQTQFSFYGNYQVVDRVDLSFSHNFSRQLTGRIGIFYEHTDPSGHYPQETIPPSPYTNGSPNVNREGIGAGLRYAFNEWMDIDLSADVENRNDHTDKTYRNYTGVLGVTFYLSALRPRGRTAISR